MNFFEHQEQARQSSRWLIFLFIIATLSIIGFLDLIFSSFYLLSINKVNASYTDIPLAIHIKVSLCIAAFILLMTLYRSWQLRAGGYKVAEALGGRRLTQDTNTVTELRLLNIVEEMAIAAGTETPTVYILEDSAINAFAAGLTIHDAVIGVTRGAVDLLNREELQGVIAHEFSHILNGDMRLNVKMLGVLFGITCISSLGHQFTYAGRHSRNAAPIVIAGVGMVIIGFIGIFFASMIKAAISRQREYLADASAVQYTRSIDGIAGALKKIGGWSIGSYLAAPRAAEYSHFYIAEGVSLWARGFFETHPPLKKRIQRIDHSWDGQFPYVSRSLDQIVDQQRRREKIQSDKFKIDQSPDISIAALTSALALTGMPNIQHVQYANKMLEDIPVDILDALHNPLQAYALSLLLFLNKDISNWPQRLENINADILKEISPYLFELSPLIKNLHTMHRLPLLELSIPTLKRLLPDQQTLFKQDVIKVIQSNNKIELWEWALYRIIRLSLSQPKPIKVKYTKFTQIQAECELILAAMSHISSHDKTRQQRTYLAAAKHLGLNTLPPEKFTLSTTALKKSLDKITRIKPLLKPRFLKALVLAIEQDGKVKAEEVELIRAISESIDCPMPPILGEHNIQ